MSGTLWSKFFWSDWESDTALRMCSLAAQGLWMRLLCVAAQHDPIGFVAVNGRPLDGQDIARVAGVSVPEAESLLQELDRNGVFSRDRKQRIYSRRMVRDAKKSATAIKNGKGGGNPTLIKQTVIPASVIPPDKTEVKPQEPRAKYQEERISPPSEAPPPPLEDPVLTVVNAWNDMAKRTGLSSVEKITAPRKAKTLARISDVGLDRVLAALQRVEESAFLRGQEGDRKWKADFDFFVTESKFTKLIEGSYGNGASGADASQSGDARRTNRRLDDFQVLRTQLGQDRYRSLFLEAGKRATTDDDPTWNRWLATIQTPERLLA